MIYLVEVTWMLQKMSREFDINLLRAINDIEMTFITRENNIDVLQITSIG